MHTRLYDLGVNVEIAFNKYSKRNILERPRTVRRCGGRAEGETEESLKKNGREGRRIQKKKNDVVIRGTKRKKKQKKRTQSLIKIIK